MPINESILIDDAKHGDLDAFNNLVLIHQTRVFNLSFRILGDGPSAEDNTQSTFLIAYQKLSGFHGGSFIAWLLRIATNQCYDHLRHQKRRPTIPLEPLNEDDETLESASWMKDTQAGPEERFDQIELETAIQRCIGALPIEYRTVAVLVDVQGLDYETAAGIIKTPLGTIKSRLARARLRLRECLLGVWELLPPSIRLNLEGTER